MGTYVCKVNLITVHKYAVQTKELSQKNKILQGFFGIQQASFKSFRDIIKKNYKNFLSTHFYDLRIKGGN